MQNAMVSSIVSVTNLPRKKVVEWFEDKRNEDGVPKNRLPYQRSASLLLSLLVRSLISVCALHVF